MGIINDRIRERRTVLGLTLLEVAEYLGVKEATAQRYESGAIKSIGHETVVKLAELLKCDPSFLMGWSSSVSGSDVSLCEAEKNLIIAYRKLNPEGRKKLCERADELLELGYTVKGDAEKLA